MVSLRSLSLLCFVLFVCGAMAESPNPYAAFSEFVTKYGREYHTAKEAEKRFDIFSRNLDLIIETNQKGLSYQLGVGPFADWTFEEFRAQYLMSSPQNCSAAKGSAPHYQAKPPAAMDWRKKNVVTRVKDQKSCGSCWTFSSTGALESHHAISHGTLAELSEQQLLDCARNYHNFGCEGGLPSQAFEYIYYNKGLDTEECYPYEARDHKCRFKKECVGAHVTKVHNITKDAEIEIVDAVGLVGPVSVAYQVVDDFMHYKSGVYSSTECRNDPQHINHAVLAVGYDTTTDSHAIPYWIVKNSWSPDWGLDGYFWIKRGDNMCGIAACASYPSA